MLLLLFLCINQNCSFGLGLYFHTKLGSMDQSSSELEKDLDRNSRFILAFFGITIHWRVFVCSYTSLSFSCLSVTEPRDQTMFYMTTECEVLLY